MSGYKKLFEFFLWSCIGWSMKYKSILEILFLSDYKKSFEYFFIEFPRLIHFPLISFFRKSHLFVTVACGCFCRLNTEIAFSK